MKTICLRYLLILGSILFLALIWEFWLEDVALHLSLLSGEPEDLSERFEYVVTVFVFSLVSLLYPYFHARQEVHAREKHEQERERLIAQLQDALEEIKTLRGFIPICAYCKKIRDDQDIWTQLEAYLYAHSDAQFSHVICPDCMQKQMSMIAQNPPH